MIRLDELSFLGYGLNRPECVLAHQSGLLITPDWTGTGGVSIIRPDGVTKRILARNVAYPIRPNGITLQDGGSILLAHLGPEEGGIFKLHPSGDVEPVLTQVGGHKLPPTNFVTQDRERRLWITVSTRLNPRSLGYRSDAGDGFVVLVDRSGARIVADGLGYSNECWVDLEAGRVFVNETFARRLAVFDLHADGSLSGRRTFAAFGPGTFPDGLARDCEGGLWITSIVSNRVIRVAPDGRQEIILQDLDPAHVDWVEDAFNAGTMDRPHLDTVKSSVLMNISNLAFGGPGKATCYLGCLLGDKIASFPAPVQGSPPPHWDAKLGELANFISDE